MLMNKESKRETPAVVSFGDKMRFIGTDGAAKISMNPKNTPHQLKRLLGKQFKDPAVQADIARLPFKVSEGPDGGCLVHVTFCNEPASFTPEQLMAMVLVDLKKIAEAESGIAVTDCAISVPTYYTGGSLGRRGVGLWCIGSELLTMSSCGVCASVGAVHNMTQLVAEGRLIGAGSFSKQPKLAQAASYLIISMIRSKTNPLLWQ